MPDHQYIDQLIDTYHVLNSKVRPLGDERLSVDASGGSVEDVLRRMRDDELRFSQALRERTTGVGMPSVFGADEMPVIGGEAAEEPASVLISQFGSAREVTLSLLRGLPDPVWDEMSGGKTIRAHVEELAQNDQRQLSRIAALLGSAAPA